MWSKEARAGDTSRVSPGRCHQEVGRGMQDGIISPENIAGGRHTETCLGEGIQGIYFPFLSCLITAQNVPGTLGHVVWSLGQAVDKPDPGPAPAAPSAGQAWVHVLGQPLGSCPSVLARQLPEEGKALSG